MSCLTLAFFSGCLLAADPTSNIQIDADFFELDANRNNVIASGNVVVTQADIILYGDKATYDQRSQLIDLKHNIRLIKGEMTLYCDTVRADGVKNTISAKGNVRFSFKDMKGLSESIEFDIDKQELVLAGSPKAWQGQDLVQGDMIFINLKKNKVTTKGKAKIYISPKRL